jgi:spore coat-associated protein N
VKSVRVTAVAGVVVVALGLLSYQAWAAFTDSAQGSFTVGAATLEVTLANSEFAVDAADMQPGDVVKRTVDFEIESTAGQLQGPEITSEATVSSLLDTDETNGLQVLVEVCDQGWELDDTCDGTDAIVLAERPIIFNQQSMDNLTLDDGDVNHLLFTISLPQSADDDFQGESSTIEFTLRAHQPNAGSFPR